MKKVNHTRNEQRKHQRKRNKNKKNNETFNSFDLNVSIWNKSAKKIQKLLSNGFLFGTFNL